MAIARSNVFVSNGLVSRAINAWQVGWPLRAARLTREADMLAIAKRFIADRSGATAVEYGIILAVLSLVIVSGIQLSGDAVQNVWVRIANKIDESWRN